MSHETSVINQSASKDFDKFHGFIANALVVMAMLFISAFSVPALAQSENDAPSKLVVFGDSLVAGYGLSPGEAFPEQLQKALDENGIDITVENAGVSGDTTTGGLARLDWSIGEGVDMVVVELGANDALRGISPEITRKNLDEIITRLKDRNISVILAGMLAPPNMGAGYEAEFNPIYADLAQKHAIPLYPFFLEGVAADPELNQADGIHPTAEGITVIADNFLPFLKDNLPDL